MNRSLLLWSLILLAESLFAQNPLIRDQFTADPTARVFEGKVYVYPSHDIPSVSERFKDWFCMAVYPVFSSENLVEWTDHGVIVSQDKVSWVDSDSYSMWAPDCVYRNGKYYFYFPAVQDSTMGNGKDYRAIGVAVADRPFGPFVPEPEPIKGLSGIDPCVLIDHDGQAYIYWQGGALWMAKLKENMLELASEPVPVSDLPEGFKEGPFVFERKGKYYYTFPYVQDQTEALAYSMGDSPEGPFEFKGIIMDQSPARCWTNHQSIVEYKDQWYLFYHHFDLSHNWDKTRSICADSLFFNPDGTIRKVVPTLRGVGVTDAKKEIQLDRYSRLSDKGAAIKFLNDNNTFEGWKTILSEADAYVQYNTVDFGNKKIKKIKARVSSVSGGVLLVRVDGLNSPVVARINVPKGTQWIEVNASLLKQQKGIHNVFVSLEGEGNVEIDWISFFTSLIHADATKTLYVSKDIIDFYK
ncbi:MAG: family 43 glycosylhydrolase [Tannerella sp.]|nr:family 43 glycosylhydrolase [Tannerella sp.]